MDCLRVRDELPEYVLSGLQAEERAFVDRHLEWCAGCRKEASHLLGGAASVGRLVPQVTPPAHLEDQVVREVHRAAGRQGGRRRPRVLRATLVAVLVLGVVGWGANVNARYQSERQARSDSEQRAAKQSLEIQRLIEVIQKTISGSRPGRGSAEEAVGQARQVTLVPPPGRQGGGGAVVYTSPTSKDWALVVVGGLPERQLPYHVMLRSSSGATLLVGKIKELDSSGGGEVWTVFPRNLRPFRFVVVRDRGGAPALRATLPGPAEGVPSPS